MEGKHHSTSYTGCGIYALVNIGEGKVYVGKSSNVKKRFQSHRSNFKRKSKSLSIYSNDISSFFFIVLEKLSREQFDQFGSIYELSYMKAFIDWNVELYNQIDNDNID